jgi:hypothetical protein
MDKYILLVERAVSDENGVCAEKYTEAYEAIDGESLDEMFSRISKGKSGKCRWPANEIKIIPVVRAAKGEA